MTVKKSFGIILVAAAISAGSIWGYGQYQQKDMSGLTDKDHSSLFKNASYTGTLESGPGVDFEKAATKAVPSVVHIKTITTVKASSNIPDMQNHPFFDFFGDEMLRGRGSAEPQQKRGSGSGVIITADGYIVTNNHVVDGADELSVTLSNNKTYTGKVIGRDPSTDLAVIKIDANNLPSINFASSDDTHLGQWVLAIGYPLNLDATVTSGIISAKSRSIGINSRQSKTPLEAFIQTDAAINPGNSGGALVNTEGDLIGINSAIASPTGSYAGYGYAIPSNIVKKVAGDLIKFGSSKRAYLGIMFGNDRMTEEDREKNNIKEGKGVFVIEVSPNSAASEAGIQQGDFITKINGTTIKTGTEIIEKIAAMRPGDKVNISFQRNGMERSANVVLKGDAGTYASIKEQAVEQLGASLEALDEQASAKLGISGGLVVKKLGQGLLAQQTRIKEGFIILSVNNQKVSSVEALQMALGSTGNSAIISGIYPGQPNRVYQYALNDLQ